MLFILVLGLVRVGDGFSFAVTVVSMATTSNVVCMGTVTSVVDVSTGMGARVGDCMERLFFSLYPGSL